MTALTARVPKQLSTSLPKPMKMSLRKHMNGYALPAGLIAAAALFFRHRARTSGRTVGDVMVDDVLTVDASAPLWRAAQLMRDGNVGVLPVVEDGRLRGIVTLSSLALRSRKKDEALETAQEVSKRSARAA